MGGVQSGLLLTFFALLASQMGLRQVWADNVGNRFPTFPEFGHKETCMLKNPPKSAKKNLFMGLFAVMWVGASQPVK